MVRQLRYYRLSKHRRQPLGALFYSSFYAGIYGIMKYTGLVDTIASWVIAFSNETTFPAIAAILTGIISYFIPSGGSKWVIEAPFLIPAGQALGIPDAQTVIAYMFGGDLTALVQPFFAVPFMAVCGLEFKDFVGYSFVAFIVLGIIMVVGLTVIPLLFKIMRDRKKVEVWNSWKTLNGFVI